MARRRETDSMRSRVYNAEWAASAKHPGKRYRSHAAVERRTRAILDRAYVRRNYVVPPISIRERRSNAHACCEYGYGGTYTLAFPRPDRIESTSWAWSDWVIVHEIAHALAAEKHGRRIAGHGREFVIIMLDLVRNVMGREAHDIFKAALRERGVKTSKPRPRKPMTDEQRAAAADRLAKARAVRDANRAAALAGPVAVALHDGRWSAGQTPDGRWVVIGPDGKRFTARDRWTANERVQREARDEGRAGVACRLCLRPFGTRGWESCGLHRMAWDHETHEDYKAREVAYGKAALAWVTAVANGETPPPLTPVTTPDPFGYGQPEYRRAWMEENGVEFRTEPVA